MKQFRIRLVMIIALAVLLTARQIQKLVQDGFCNGKEFCRVVKGHVIQTGGGDAPNLPPEFNKNPHLMGTVGLGRDKDVNSGNSEF